MAKFCGNCGAPLESGTRVCGQCGKLVEDAFGSNPAPKTVVKEEPQRVKQSSLLFKLPGIVGIVLVLAVGASLLLANFTGYKGLAREAMSACVQYDPGTLADMASINYSEMNEDALEELFASRIDRVLSRLDVDDWKDADLSYEIEGYFEMPVWMIEAVTGGQAPEEYLEVLDEVRIASALVTDDQSPHEEPVRLLLILVKEDGKWKLAEMQAFA